MRTNIEIDDALLAEAMHVLGTVTKRETIAESLRQTVRARKQQEALNALWGIGWEGDLEEMRTDKPLPEWE